MTSEVLVFQIDFDDWAAALANKRCSRPSAGGLNPLELEGLGAIVMGELYHKRVDSHTVDVGETEIAADIGLMVARDL